MLTFREIAVSSPPLGHGVDSDCCKRISFTADWKI